MRRPDFPDDAPSRKSVTTLLLSNIPACTGRAQMLEHFTNAGFEDCIDLLYIPAVKARCRTKYRVGVVNLVTVESALRFQQHYDASVVFHPCGQDSVRPLVVKPAETQGLEATIMRHGASGSSQLLERADSCIGDSARWRAIAVLSGTHGDVEPLRPIHKEHRGPARIEAVEKWAMDQLAKRNSRAADALHSTQIRSSFAAERDRVRGAVLEQQSPATGPGESSAGGAVATGDERRDVASDGDSGRRLQSLIMQFCQVQTHVQTDLSIDQQMSQHVYRDLSTGAAPQLTPITTMMISSIPGSVTREDMLIEFAKRGFDSSIDYLYLHLVHDSMFTFSIINCIGEKEAQSFRQFYDGSVAFHADRTLMLRTVAVRPTGVQGLEALLSVLANDSCSFSQLQERAECTIGPKAQQIAGRLLDAACRRREPEVNSGTSDEPCDGSTQSKDRLNITCFYV